MQVVARTEELELLNSPVLTSSLLSPISCSRMYWKSFGTRGPRSFRGAVAQALHGYIE